MSGNTYGKLFTVTTAGESHGPALVAIVDGCPPGIELSLEDMQRDLDRRKPGTSRHTTQRQEDDVVEILSGVFEGKTTGCSIGLLIRNTDQKSKDYSAIKDLFRPAHADYTYHHKYGIRDYRGGGRSSARETAMRVAAGAIAKKVLAGLGIQVRGYMSQLGPIEIPFKTWESVEQNAFFSPDPDKVPELEAYMDQLRRDHLGRVVGERVRRAIESTPIRISPIEQVHITVSIGGAFALQWIRSTKQLWVERADQQLYVAKQAGRNRMSIEDQPDSTVSAEEKNMLFAPVFTPSGWGELPPLDPPGSVK